MAEVPLHRSLLRAGVLAPVVGVSAAPIAMLGNWPERRERMEHRVPPRSFRGRPDAELGRLALLALATVPTEPDVLEQAMQQLSRAGWHRSTSPELATALQAALVDVDPTTVSPELAALAGFDGR